MIDFLHISHVEKLLHMTICHMEKFLHMTDFFSTSTVCGACDKYQVCSVGVYYTIKLDIRASDVAKNWIQEPAPKDTGGPNLDKNRIQL